MRIQAFDMVNMKVFEPINEDAKCIDAINGNEQGKRVVDFLLELSGFSEEF